MKDIGIVICNYNKKDDVINCVKSILASTFPRDAYEVLVVDNASEDGSVMALKELYADSIMVIENQENLGGSGGFCAGLKHFLNIDFKYIMCVDNDVVFDKEAVRILFEFMEKHAEVGIAGSKILMMDVPDRIQGLGIRTNYDTYENEDIYGREKDSLELPEFIYCDYVPACSLIAKKTVIEKVGLMPVENFIYWDDIEWCMNVRLAGYKIAAVSGSRVWHRGGGKSIVNTFPKYYSIRNRICFFLKFLPAEKWKNFCEVILDEVYRMIVASMLKKDYAVSETVIYALDDAIHHVSGKAADYKILQRKQDDRLEKLLHGKKTVGIVYDGDMVALEQILQKFQTMAVDMTCSIYLKESDREKKEELQEKHPNYLVKEYRRNIEDILFIMCPHIFEVADEKREGIYIDRWINLLVDEEDYCIARNFKTNCKLYIEMNLPLMMHAAEKYHQIFNA